MDPWTIGALIAGAVVLIWGIKAIRARLDDIRYREELAEMEFEQSLLSQLSDVEGESRIENVIQDQAVPINEMMMPQIQEPIFSRSAADSEEQSQLLARLERGGLVKNVEGYLELHGDPKGVVIVRLKNNKTALLVPHLESEGFLRRNSRRADMVFMMASDGNAYAVRRIEEVIAELV